MKRKAPKSLSRRPKKLRKITVNVKSAKPSRSRPSKQVNRSFKSRDDALAAYAAALNDPFSPVSVGARVPDLYSYPTATYHNKSLTTVTSDSGGAFNVLLLAQPYCAMVSPNVATNNTGMYQYTAAGTAYAAVSVNNMSALLNDYRVVGVGHEVRNLMPPTTCTGILSVASIPAPKVGLGPNLLENSALSAAQIYERLIGVSTVTNEILDLPKSGEWPAQDFIAQRLLLTHSVTGPGAFEFKSSDTQVAIGATISVSDSSVSAVATHTNIETSSDRGDSTAFGGFDIFILHGDGFPPSTNVLTIQTAFHIEGTPEIANGNGTMMPDSLGHSHVNPRGMDDVLSASSIMSHMLVLGDAASSVYGAYKRAGPMGVVNQAANILAKLGLNQ